MADAAKRAAVAAVLAAGCCWGLALAAAWTAFRADRGTRGGSR